jgi:hypothetical protein
MGFAENKRDGAMQHVRRAGAVYGKNGNEFYHFVFYRPDNSD